MIRVSCGIALIFSFGVVMASTQRWRGAGNKAENASWTPGASAARYRTSASSSLTSSRL